MGTCHASRNGENQDALCCGKNRNFCVISLADGVSACRDAKRGAAIASQAITDLFLNKGDHFLEFEDGQIAELALSHVLFELRRLAVDASHPIEELSSTIASVLIDRKKRRMLCFNLGDGIIMGTGNGKCRVLSMPADSSSGCCVTTTKGAERAARVKRFDIGSLETVVICSDGAWGEMFSGNRLRPEVLQMLSRGEYDPLKDFLAGRDCRDDHSFISLDMRQSRRKSA